MESLFRIEHYHFLIFKKVKKKKSKDLVILLVGREMSSLMKMPNKTQAYIDDDIG
jgi:hypothetical protein